MSRRDLRAELAAKRAAMRARVRADLARRRPERPARPRRRRRWIWLLLLLLLLLLISLCCCEDVRPELPEAVPETVVAPVGEAPAPEPEPAPEPPGRVASIPRPGFEPRKLEPLGWVQSFRMQVAARAPRLAQCFVGAARPGSLKWTASVVPGTGRVSDHELEPTLMSDSLTQAQRACVLGALSDPAYTLEVAGDATAPTRVGVVIEF